MTDNKPDDTGAVDETNADARLASAVRVRLQEDEMVNGAHISVSVADGLVTLEGSVTDRWSKERIEDAAANADGVTELDSRIEIKRIFTDGQS